MLVKYRKRWITRYNPNSITYQTAIDTHYKPPHLSPLLVEELTAMFMKLDRELDCGCSRQLVLDCLMLMGLYKDEKDRNAFYNKSGYDRMRSKMLKSMSLIEFLNEIDTHA